ADVVKGGNLVPPGRRGLEFDDELGGVGRDVILEIGKLARQAPGKVLEFVSQPRLNAVLHAPEMRESDGCAADTVGIGKDVEKIAGLKVNLSARQGHSQLHVSPAGDINRLQLQRAIALASGVGPLVGARRRKESRAFKSFKRPPAIKKTAWVVVRSVEQDDERFLHHRGCADRDVSINVNQSLSCD